MSRAPSVSVCAGGAAAGADRPEPEVCEKQTYRRLTAEYKLRILREADACKPGEIGALLRREGLYSSHLTRWRKQRESGVLDALISRKRGRRADPETPMGRQPAKLELENDRLRKRLRRHERRGGKEISAMMTKKMRRSALALKLRRVDVQIHPINALNRKCHMIPDDFRHRLRDGRGRPAVGNGTALIWATYDPL